MTRKETKRGDGLSPVSVDAIVSMERMRCARIVERIIAMRAPESNISVMEIKEALSLIWKSEEV